jgi:hypothetical protein
METKIKASQGEVTQGISAFQERIIAGQAEFEERATRTLDTQLKSVTTRVEQQAQELRDDFNKETRATQRYFETRLAAMDARKRRTGNGNVGINAGQVMPPKFGGTTPWSAFHRHCEATADNNGWTPGENPTIC